MKRWIVFAILFLAASAWAGPPKINGTTVSKIDGLAAAKFNGLAGGSSYFCDSKSGYLLCEDLEGSSSCQSGSAYNNCRNTWSVGNDCINAPNYGYTPSLEGAKSLYLSEGDGGLWCGIYKSFTTSDSIYLYTVVKVDTISFTEPSDHKVIVEIGNSSGADDYCDSLIKDYSGTLYWTVYSNGSFSPSSIVASANTTYYVWMDYTRNTTNGCKMYISSTKTKPSQASASVTSGNNAASSIQILAYTGGTTYHTGVYDDILVSTTSIGDQ